MSATNQPTLRSGSGSSEDVSTLQQKLAQVGFAVEPDGKFGPNTERAVKELQAVWGYDVDGVVGAGTWALLDKKTDSGWNVSKPEDRLQAFNAQSDAAKSIDGVLRKGASGQQVWFLQNRLTLLGFSLGVDGQFGPGTDAVVRELQTLFGYDVDGDVGPGTNKLINAQIGYGWNRQHPEAAEKAQASQG